MDIAIWTIENEYMENIKQSSESSQTIRIDSIFSFQLCFGLAYTWNCPAICNLFRLHDIQFMRWNKGYLEWTLDSQINREARIWENEWEWWRRKTNNKHVLDIKRYKCVHDRAISYWKSKSIFLLFWCYFSDTFWSEIKNEFSVLSIGNNNRFYYEEI